MRKQTDAKGLMDAYLAAKGKSERYIKVSDIGKVCDPYRDHDVRTYTAEEIAESIRKNTPKWEELWITEESEDE